MPNHLSSAIQQELKSKNIFDTSFFINFDRKHNTLSQLDLNSSFRKSAKEEIFQNRLLKKKILRFEGGFASYAYYYRSGLDTPYNHQSLSENFINANLKFTIGELLPLNVFYFERETNSDYFKSYRDIKIDFDVQRYKQSRQKRQLTYFEKYANSLRNPSVQTALEAVERKENQYRTWLDNPQVVSKLIQSKELINRNEYVDSLLPFKDSLLQNAKAFVSLYDTINNSNQHYQKLDDSLITLISETEKKIESLKKLTSKSSFKPDDAKQLIKQYGQEDEHTKQLLKSYDGIQQLSIGKSVHNFSNLSLQNININGLSVQYRRSHVFMDAAAGTVVYRLRDFLYKQQRTPKQFVFAGRIGYGNKENNNIILTYYAGKKQLFGGNLQSPTSFVQGLSIAGQYFIVRNTKLYIEIAQSGLPQTYPTVFSTKSTFHFDDHSQQAYAVGLNSQWSTTGTKMEGYFQHTGLNFQSFNSFPYHSVVNRWYGSLEQKLWKKRLSVMINVRKNDFDNPTVLQRYNANTIFKTLTVSFHKSKLPSFSFGYMPSSQYTVVDSTVYENHYQTFTATSSYQYRIGIIKAVSSFVYSQFYNDNKDSGLIYYNSKNLYWNQVFMFQRFNAAINISSSVNSRYQFYVMEENLSALFFKKITLGGSVKIDNLNNTLVKVGFNTSARIMIKNIGQLNIYAEKSYLPTSQNQLYKYETYNVGITRYFK